MKRLVFLFLLAGCQAGPTRPDVLQSLVGHTEADAIRTLGAPNRTFQANGSTFLAFADTSVGYAPVPFAGGFGYGYGFGFIGPTAVPVVRGCETTIEIVGGIVRSWSLRGGGC